MTEYKQYSTKLSNNQHQKLVKAISLKTPITIRLGANDLTRSYKLFLTSTQINRIKKAKRLNTGVDITFSKTHISKLKSMVGSGLQNRPVPRPQPTKTGKGLRNRPFNINDYAQYKPPPFIGSWSHNDNTIKKKQFPIIGMKL